MKSKPAKSAAPAEPMPADPSPPMPAPPQTGGSWLIGADGKHTPGDEATAARVAAARAGDAPAPTNDEEA